MSASVCVCVGYGVQQVDRTSDALLMVAASLRINMHTLAAVKTHFIVSLQRFNGGGQNLGEGRPTGDDGQVSCQTLLEFSL